MMNVGDTMSTSGDVQYIGGCSVHRGMFSTSEGYHEYIGGCSVHWRVTMSTSGGYHEYIGGCSVHRRDIMIYVGSNLIKSFQFPLKTPMY